MSNYIVSDTDLTSVANAIRTKGGTSAQLAFPAGFVSAIGDLPGGGGSYVAADWGDPTKPTGAVTINIAYAYADRDSSSGLLERRTGITDVSLPNATALPHNFAQYSSITSLNAPLVQTAGQNIINRCSGMTGLVLPSLNDTYSNGAFEFATNLQYADFGGATGGTLKANTFSGNAKMSVLVLRATSAWTLDAISAFNNTPFASGKAGGTLYVPNSLIATYQSASNWSTILGYATNQIKSIESTHTDPNAPIDLTLYYADGTPIPTT